jgi:hypothetical protein
LLFGAKKLYFLKVQNESAEKATEKLEGKTEIKFQFSGWKITAIMRNARTEAVPAKKKSSAAGFCGRGRKA